MAKTSSASRRMCTGRYGPNCGGCPWQREGYWRLADWEPLNVPAAAKPATVLPAATPPMIAVQWPAPAPAPAPVGAATTVMSVTWTTCEAPAATGAPGIVEPLILTLLPTYLARSFP